MKMHVLGLSLLWAATSSSLFAQATFTRISKSPVTTDNGDGWSCAWVDFNNDGLLDLFVSGWTGPNRLYRNDGNGVFTRLTTGAIQGATGAIASSWADIDNDGLLDVFLGAQNGDPGSLFLQQSDGTFVETVLPLGSTAKGGAWGDYDKDGFVDLRIGDPTIDTLWHNDGLGKLTPLDSGPQVAPDAGQVTWIDFDNDGYSDLAITSSAVSDGPCRLFHNNGNGSFTEVEGAFAAATRSTGIAWGDYDNDGFPDAFICRLHVSFTRELVSMLYRNNGNGTFTQVQQSPFTNEFGFSGGCAWGDYDNDGWLDLIVSSFGTDANNRLYHNNGDETFTRLHSGPGGDGTGSSNGVAWGDYDRDGFLDLFIANSTSTGNSPIAQASDFLYHNNGNSNAWITVKCVGSRSNRSGIGAKVRVKATIAGKTLWQMREINTGYGNSQSAMEAHFGLGTATNVETLRIEWPSGTVQEFQNVPAKKYLSMVEPARWAAAEIKGAPQFTLEGGRNLSWVIQSSTNLVDWSYVNGLVPVLVTNVNGKITITDTNAPATGAFYRAFSQDALNWNGLNWYRPNIGR